MARSSRYPLRAAVSPLLSAVQVAIRHARRKPSPAPPTLSEPSNLDYSKNERSKFAYQDCPARRMIWRMITTEDPTRVLPISGPPELAEDLGEGRGRSLTLAQHARIARLPDDFKCVGWDSAWRSPITAGPLIEDPLDHHICRLSPSGKLLNNPSDDALEELARRRRERVALRRVAARPRTGARRVSLAPA